VHGKGRNAKMAGHGNGTEKGTEGQPTARATNKESHESHEIHEKVFAGGYNLDSHKSDVKLAPAADTKSVSCASSPEATKMLHGFSLKESVEQAAKPACSPNTPLSQEEVKQEATKLEALADAAISNKNKTKNWDKFNPFQTEVADLAKDHGLQSVKDVFNKIESDSSTPWKMFSPQFSDWTSVEKDGSVWIDMHGAGGDIASNVSKDVVFTTMHHDDSLTFMMDSISLHPQTPQADRGVPQFQPIKIPDLYLQPSHEQP
jgi:hypothetical protein